MIDHDEARRIALQYLAEAEDECRKIADLRKDLKPEERRILGLGAVDEIPELALVESATIEGDFGWVFSYETKKYLNSGDLEERLIGNAPILISRRDGSLHVTGTGDPPEFYIENFKRCGNPHG